MEVPIPNSPEGRAAYKLAHWLCFNGQKWKMEVWRRAQEVAREEEIQFDSPTLGDDPDGLDPIIQSILDRANILKAQMMA